MQAGQIKWVFMWFLTSKVMQEKWKCHKKGKKQTKNKSEKVKKRWSKEIEWDDKTQNKTAQNKIKISGISHYKSLSHAVSIMLASLAVSIISHW